MFCAYIRPRYQVSIYRTIAPLVLHSVAFSLQVAAEFAKVLLHLTEGFSLPSFRGQRFNSLVALTVCAPKPVSKQKNRLSAYLMLFDDI